LLEPEKRTEKNKTPYKKKSVRWLDVATGSSTKSTKSEIETPIFNHSKKENDHEYKNFCNQTGCDCIYTFRDNVAGDCSPNKSKIIPNQLYIRGWDPLLVKWETVRQRIYDELKEFPEQVITQVYIDPKGFGFLKFSNHERATLAQQILKSVNSFYGDKLLVNFATER